jgi:hypothetical protein
MSLKRNSALVVLLLASLPGGLAGQAIVEHAVISGGAAAVAGSAHSAAGTISGVLKKVDGTLDTAGKKRRTAAAPVLAPTMQEPVDPAKPAKTYEDPVGIKAGIAYAELLRRFGEPSMRITGDSGEQTLYYFQKNGRGETQVRVSGGQVLSVDE